MIGISTGWIKYNQDMLKCCTNEIKHCKKSIKMYQDFLKEENNFLYKGYYREWLKDTKERLEKLKKEKKEHEIYLAKLKISEAQDNNEQFKVIQGGIA